MEFFDEKELTLLTSTPAKCNTLAAYWDEYPVNIWSAKRINPDEKTSDECDDDMAIEIGEKARLSLLQVGPERAGCSLKVKYKKMSNHSLFLKLAYIKTPLQNGVGRYVGQLQRVVLKFCKNNGSSRGMREFIESGLVNFAKDNPGVVVYLKPRRHRTAIIKAEYLNGETQWINCRNFTQEEIAKWLNLLKSQSRNTTNTRFLKLIHTDHPSIQGPWTPYTFRDPKLNLVDFPNEELSNPPSYETTTHEQLVELFKKQKLEELDDKRAE
ncbi:hypothetical protein NQ317_018776 [Molorchus minor]|uniref:Large ribosomal subunit protein mL43 n=1 Tax=Molorchus minor TaxID=1323400 RepID=A0ABQ9J4T7_9CUCU|nr:hypothetical protein NQ317_018776 [Molorchus minor]